MKAKKAFIKKKLLLHLDQTTLLLLFLSFLLIAYTTFKANRLAFTHDESFSYLIHAQLSIKDIIQSNSGLAPSNNHILNTLLMKTLSHFFGERELVLRSLSLFGHFLYLLSSIFITKRLKKFLLILFGFILLNFNPFVLDFFHLGRGYGLAMGIMLLSVVYLIKYIEHKNVRGFVPVISVFLAYLAVLANFTFLNFYLSLIATFCIIFIIHRLKDTNKDIRSRSFFIHLLIKFLLLLFALMAPIATILPVIIKLKKIGDFYFGGDISFWKDTVGSLIQSTIYTQPYFKLVADPLRIFIIIVLLLALFFVVHRFRKERFSKTYLIFISFFIIMILSVLSTIAQHYLLGNKYLIERTGIFFLPMFSLFTVFTIQQLVLNSKNLFRRIMYVILIVIMVLVTSNLVKNINFTHTLIWYQDSDTKKLIEDIQKYREDHPLKKDNITLASDWPRGQFISFYIKKFDLYWLNYDRMGIEKGGDFDLYYCNEIDLIKVESKDVDVLNKYSLSGYTLLKSDQ